MHERCSVCKKRTGPIAFACKCDGVFCARHRHPEEHGCTFDHKEDARARLAADNPKVVAAKVREV